MEAIKLVVGECPSYSRRLLIFDGYSGAFRVVSLRPKQSGCAVCGDTPTITDLERVDYVRFCGRGATDKVNLITFYLGVSPLMRRTLSRILYRSFGIILLLF